MKSRRFLMTPRELILMTGLHLAAFVVVAYLTRANVRRIEGALAGGSVFAVVALLGLAVGERYGWWRVPGDRSWAFQLALWLVGAVSCSPVYLITWRVARRFGSVGLAICVLVAVVIGPPRDYIVARVFPNWIVFAPGVAPVVAVAIIYALLVTVGHAVMFMVAGPSDRDPLAGRWTVPWVSSHRRRLSV
jgi:hypothetical protein